MAMGRGGRGEFDIIAELKPTGEEVLAAQGMLAKASQAELRSISGCFTAKRMAQGPDMLKTRCGERKWYLELYSI